MQDHTLYIDELNLMRPDAVFKAVLCCCFLSRVQDYENIVQYLHPEEHGFYARLQFEKRIKSYLMGRFVAKQAVAAFIGEEDLRSIFIQSGIFTQPVVVSNKHNVQVSISHCDNFGAALAFPEAHPMALDIEKINPDKRAVLESQITEAERELLCTCSPSYDIGLTLLWTAKEALSKVLKTGLTTPFGLFEISSAEWHNTHTECHYKNFAQYKSVSFTVGNYVCSLIHPVKTEIHFNLCSLVENFAFIGSGGLQKETFSTEAKISGLFERECDPQSG